MHWKTPNNVIEPTRQQRRYDNEAGKGDHRHFGEKESNYTFQTPEKLIADFERDIARWNRENRNS